MRIRPCSAASFEFAERQLVHSARLVDGRTLILTQLLHAHANALSAAGTFATTPPRTAALTRSTARPGTTAEGGAIGLTRSRGLGGAAPPSTPSRKTSSMPTAKRSDWPTPMRSVYTIPSCSRPGRCASSATMCYRRDCICIWRTTMSTTRKMHRLLPSSAIPIPAGTVGKCPTRC